MTEIEIYLRQSLQKLDGARKQITQLSYEIGALESKKNFLGIQANDARARLRLDINSMLSTRGDYAGQQRFKLLEVGNTFSIQDRMPGGVTISSGDIRIAGNIGNFVTAVTPIAPGHPSLAKMPDKMGHVGMFFDMAQGGLTAGGGLDINRLGAIQEQDNLKLALDRAHGEIVMQKNSVKALAAIHMGLDVGCLHLDVGFNIGIELPPIPGLPNFGLLIPTIPIPDLSFLFDFDLPGLNLDFLTRINIPGCPDIQIMEGVTLKINV